MSHTLRAALEALLYVILFVVIEAVVAAVLTLLRLPLATQLLLASAVSSLLTLGVFFACRWTATGVGYIRSARAALWLWVALLAAALILPMQYVEELLALDLPAELTAAFTEIINSRIGYVVIGILAPLTEEVVFRGAVLRKLLTITRPAWAVALSALLFAVVHGNLAQGCHALIIGVLLGWLYVRTRSIVPCVVVHWVNNTIAFAAVRALGSRGDVPLTELFAGQQTLLYALIAVSVVVALISLLIVARQLSSH